jgi:hypothetical protein
MTIGYSVKEAASVLGVSKRRVWELLARGVLAGTPQGPSGMRVYLQGEAQAPVQAPGPPRATPAEVREPSNGNGNGGHGASLESSPFRELLTEFRNLTERYGQALLALGEARGEVAALRSRVELLEARIDLRLPSAAPQVEWTPRSAQSSVADADVRAEADEQPVQTAEPAEEAHPPAEDAQPDALVDGSEAPAEPVAADTTPDEPWAAVPDAHPETAMWEGVHAGEPPEAPAPELSAGEFETDEEAAVVGEPPIPAAIGPTRNRPARRVRPRRPRRGRRTSASAIAEALARADDPTVTDFAGTEEPVATAPDLAEPPSIEEPVAEQDWISVTDAVAASELVTDELLADELLGGSIGTPVPEPGDAEGDEGEAIAAAEDNLEELESLMHDEFAPVERAETATPTTTHEEAEVEARAASEEGRGVGVEPTYSSEWDEPDWIAEEDLVGPWDAPGALGVADASEASVAAEPEAPTEAQPLRDTVAEAPPEAGPVDVTVGLEPLTSVSYEADELQPVEMAEEILAEVEAEPAAMPMNAEPYDEAVDEPMAAAKPSETEISAEEHPANEPAARGVVEEELMWLGDEFAPERTTWTTPAPLQSGLSERAVSAAEDQALTRLAAERGWDDEELTAIRSLLAQPEPEQVPDEPAVAPAEPTAVLDDFEAQEVYDWEQGPAAWTPTVEQPPHIDLPGAAELDEAMAALDSESAAQAENASANEAGEPFPLASADEPTAIDAGESGEDPGQVEQPPSNSASPDSSNPAPAPGVDDWLRGRRGPAANAYRRLRRLFPGS